jgi:hypothetical protein
MIRTSTFKPWLFWLALLILLVGETQLKAQTIHNPPQIICVGSERPYQVDWQDPVGGLDGTPGSTYDWSVITAGFVGTITTNQSPGGFNNRIIVNWGATPPGTYILQVIETNNGCPGLPVTLTIILEEEVTPTFNPIGPLCQNNTPPSLPNSSIEGITGTWSPVSINTSTAGTFDFVFTPDPGQCALPTTISITIDPEQTPLFDPIGPLCQNSTAPTLPGTSTNGITGTWDGAISTTTPGDFIFTFTPNDPSQCSFPISITVAITPEVTPLFNSIGPLCQNSTAPALPGISTNGITGSWDGTISTANAGDFTFTFTPDDPAQCAVTATLTVTIDPQLTPTFAQIGPLCQNSSAPALPDTSINGVPGTWSPATINTANIGTTTYTFTPDAGECAVPTTMDITIEEQVTPTFNTFGPYCQNATPDALPSTSNNGITGSWSGAISTGTPGSFDFTFTPDDPDQCGTPTTITVVVNELPTITVSDETICTGDSVDLTANGANTYAWSPDTGLSSTTGATVTASPTSTTTYTVTGTDVNNCQNSADVTVTVNPLPTTSPIFHD